MIDDRLLFTLSIFKILQQASWSFKQSDDCATGINRKGFVNVLPESTETAPHESSPQNLHPSPRISFASTKSRADPQSLTFFEHRSFPAVLRISILKTNGFYSNIIGISTMKYPCHYEISICWSCWSITTSWASGWTLLWDQMEHLKSPWRQSPGGEIFYRSGLKN